MGNLSTFLLCINVFQASKKEAGDEGDDEDEEDKDEEDEVRWLRWRWSKQR